MTGCADWFLKTRPIIPVTNITRCCLEKFKFMHVIYIHIHKFIKIMKERPQNDMRTVNVINVLLTNMYIYLCI